MNDTKPLSPLIKMKLFSHIGSARTNKERNLLSETKNTQEKMGNEFIQKTLNQNNPSSSSQKAVRAMRSFSSPELPKSRSYIERKSPHSLQRKYTDSPVCHRKKVSELVDFFDSNGSTPPLSCRCEKEEETTSPRQQRKYSDVRKFLKSFLSEQESKYGPIDKFTTNRLHTPPRARKHNFSENPLNAILNEIIQSEQTYNKQLSFLANGLELYLEENKKEDFFAFLKKSKRDEAHSNLKLILEQAVQLKMFSDLFMQMAPKIAEIRAEQLDQSLIKPVKLEPIDIIKLFEGSNFGAYLQAAQNFKVFLKFKEHLSEEEKILYDQKLAKLVANEEQLDYESLIITMTQRLPRYELLIKELLKNIPRYQEGMETEQYKAFSAALSSVQKAVDKMNKNVRHTQIFTQAYLKNFLS